MSCSKIFFRSVFEIFFFGESWWAICIFEGLREQTIWWVQLSVGKICVYGGSNFSSVFLTRVAMMNSMLCLVDSRFRSDEEDVVVKSFEKTIQTI